MRPVKQITSLEENLPGLFQQRNIVRWAFEDDTKVGDIKRFSIASGGYVVVQLTAKVKEGLASIDEVGNQVRKTLTNNKKAALIKKQYQDKATLEALAADESLTIETASVINQRNPSIVGAGNEPYVVGVAFAMEEGATSNLIEGEEGVYKILLVKKNIAQDLDNYKEYTEQMMTSLSSRILENVFQALESIATIDDNRALYY